MAVAVEIRHTSQSPTGRKSRSKCAANENVVVQIPDRCLTRPRIAYHPVLMAIAVKVRYYRRTCARRRRRGRGRGSWCRGLHRIRHNDCAYHVAACPMRGAVIRKRASSVERVSEHGSLGENSRIPCPAGMAWSTRGAAVTGRAPGPADCVAWVNRHR